MYQRLLLLTSRRLSIRCLFSQPYNPPCLESSHSTCNLALSNTLYEKVSLGIIKSNGADIPGIISDDSTISRDIKYLTAQSQNYLNDLARSTLPFMYQTSIEGIRSILKECWNIYPVKRFEISQRLQRINI